MYGDSDVRPRSVVLDPGLLLCCLAALALYLYAGFDGALSRDVGVYTYGGQLFAEGVAPYVGIFNRAGPLAHALPGVGVAAARLVGADDVLGARILFMLVSVACVGAAYVLTRDLFRSRAAAVAAAATLISCHGFLLLAVAGPRDKTPMVLFLLLALIAVRGRRWTSAGVLVSLATLTWQPVFFPLSAALVVAVLRGVPRGGGRLEALGRYALGGLVPLGLTLAAYAGIGRLQLFLDCFVLVNARYTRQDHVWDDPAENAREMVAGYGPSVVLLAGGLVALWLLAGRTLRRGTPEADPEPRPAGPDQPTGLGRSTPPPDRLSTPATVVTLGAAAAVAVIWTALAFDSWPDTFLLLPFAAVGVGGAVDHLRHRATQGVAVAVAATVLVGGLGSAASYAADIPPDLAAQRRSVAALMEVLPGAEVMSVEATQSLVLTGGRNPSRFQLFGNGAHRYVDAVWPGGIEGYARWIARQAPTAIAQQGPPPWWLRGVLADYRRVGRAPGWTWWVRFEVGQDRLGELRAALEVTT